MKKILLVVAWAGILPFAHAQNANTFKTSFTNNENNTLELSISVDELVIEGSAGNEIIIESVGEKNPKFKQSPPTPPDQPVPDRAKGLKPISPSVGDNTGLGILVEKTETLVRIQSGVNTSSNKFKITIPNKIKLLINEYLPGRDSDSENGAYDYVISNLEGEIIITSLNSNFKLTGIAGSLVLNTTNGNVEAVYSSMKTQKPISIVTINGFVDLTIPSATKADLELLSMNGKAYTDFEIKSNDDDKTVMHLPAMEMFHLSGKINGGGGIQININSINGDIYLRKG